MGYYDSHYEEQITRTQCARLERTATGSWITIHCPTIAPETSKSEGGFTDDQWDLIVVNLYPGWSLVLCGDDIN